MSDEYVLLTEDEAAEMLRLATRTLQKRRYEKRPPVFLKLDGVVRYRLADIKKFIDASVLKFPEAANA